MPKVKHAEGCTFARHLAHNFVTSWEDANCHGSITFRSETDGVGALRIHEDVDDGFGDDEDDDQGITEINIRFNYCPECGVHLTSKDGDVS